MKNIVHFFISSTTKPIIIVSILCISVVFLAYSSSKKVPLLSLDIVDDNSHDDNSHDDNSIDIGSVDAEALNVYRYINFMPNPKACSSHTLIGGTNPPPNGRIDGQWAICNVTLSSDCKVMSFGIFNDWSFDDEMIKKGCEVWSLDPTISGERVNLTFPPKHHFIKIGLSGHNYKDVYEFQFQTLTTLLTQNSITDLDILKIDIEGSEWDFFHQVLNTTFLETHVKQITIEIHFGHWDNVFSKCQSNTCRSSAMREKYNMIRNLEEKGFVAWSVHLNPGSTGESFGPISLPCCYEIAFINSKWQETVSW